ncbi:MAG: inositol-3-phosphate synthase [Planctomycetota bacterium]|nr:inositol-3-phosphate synthase [Planctomycetota bacterium]MDI6788060.1 inositol-3-phosphate synthase [Planctomycetota bacterium]
MQNKFLGIWIIGASGSVATSVVAGAELLAQRLIEPIGLITEIPEFSEIIFVPFTQMVFGGHEVRPRTSKESFRELSEELHINHQLIERVCPYLDAFQKNIRLGTTIGCGKGVEEAVGGTSQLDTLPLPEIVHQMEKDITDFKKLNHLEQVVVLNLASTEPPIKLGVHTETIKGFEESIRNNHKEVVRASCLYAYVAFRCGCPYINFTPSAGASIPALLEMAKQRNLSHAGQDGKTGETLIKAVLGSMFKYRALKILSWQGYNILGNMDGKVLTDPETLQSKLIAKNTVLPQVLGYKPHTHIGIDYVPSLGEWKVAWDFIHFEGFLGTKMSMQFIWQGCDSMLAVPLVLDLIRLVELSARRKESGALGHLGLFFKQPLGTPPSTHPSDGCWVGDLHHQWHHLESYLEQVKKTSYKE